MDEFDRAARVRLIWRYLAVALGVVVVSLLIGIAVGRPFARSNPYDVGAATITPAAPQAISTPTPEAALVATSATPTESVPPPTFSSDAAWKVLTQETFDSPTTWPAAEQSGWASGYEAGRYWLKLNGQRTISYSIPISSSETWVAVDVQVESGYAGLVFLGGDPKIVYRLLIDNAGRYRLERQQDGATTALRDWTAAAALRAGANASNRIEAQRIENEVTLFANGSELLKYTLPDGETLQGRAGLTLDAIARDAVALAYFDNLVVRIPVVSEDR